MKKGHKAYRVRSYGSRPKRGPFRDLTAAELDIANIVVASVRRYGVSNPKLIGADAAIQIGKLIRDQEANHE